MERRVRELSIDKCWYKEVCTQDCYKPCIRYLEMSYLMAHSNIPTALQMPKKLIPDKKDVSAFDKLAEIKSNIVEFVEQGNNVFIGGKSAGTGKTSWSIKLLLRYFDQVWPGNGFRTRGLFIHVPTFLLKCKDFNNKDADFEELKKNILTADVVVWDDIASTEISAYDYSQLLSYIDGRCNENRSNIYTGNIVDEKDMFKALGAKLTSRIFSSSTERVIFQGGDKR